MLSAWLSQNMVYNNQEELKVGDELKHIWPPISMILTVSLIREMWFMKAWKAVIQNDSS